MEKEYRVNPDTIYKNYGVYDYLVKREEGSLKTFGGINAENYLYKMGIYDHYCTWKEIEDEIGKFNFWFSNYRNGRGVNLININYSKEKCEDEGISLFQIECILGVLNECRNYCLRKPNSVEVIIPSICTKENNDIQSKDIDGLINLVLEYYNELKTPKKKINNLKIYFQKIKTKNKQK